MFSGLLFCGDCKEPMVRRINRYKGTEKNIISVLREIGVRGAADTVFQKQI